MTRRLKMQLRKMEKLYDGLDKNPDLMARQNLKTVEDMEGRFHQLGMAMFHNLRPFQDVVFSILYVYFETIF